MGGVGFEYIKCANLRLDSVVVKANRYGSSLNWDLGEQCLDLHVVSASGQFMFTKLCTLI